MFQEDHCRAAFKVISGPFGKSGAVQIACAGEGCPGCHHFLGKTDLFICSGELHQVGDIGGAYYAEDKVQLGDMGSCLDFGSRVGEAVNKVFNDGS